MSNKTKGIVGSILVHVIILVLLIIFGFSTPLPLPDEEGILINFGTDDRGMGLTEPRVSPQETTPAESKTTPENSKEKPLTQDFEEAPSIPPTKPDPKPNPKPAPEKTVETKPTETTPQETPKVEEVKPREVDPRTKFPGKINNGSDTGEGVTNTQGNQGNPDGSPTSTSHTGSPTGGNDGNGFSLAGRSIIGTLPLPDYTKQIKGDVVVEIRVDRNGNVTSAIGGAKGSTTFDQDLIKAAEEAAKKAKFDIKPNASETQVGTITYRFRLKQ
jgi:TonB family protein